MRGRSPSVVANLASRVITIAPDPVPDPLLRKQLSLTIETVNRVRGLLHQIPLGRGLHHEFAAERFPGYTFAEILQIVGTSGVLVRDKRHHTGVSCNPDLAALVIEPDGTHHVLWASSSSGDAGP